MGIHHQPSSGPDDDLSQDPLASEFSLFLAADPFRAQQIQVEASINLFCSELEEFGEIGLRDVIRMISADPPHVVVEDLRAFFYPSFEEDEKHLADSLAVAAVLIDSAVSGHLSPEHPLSYLATDALAAVAISEAVLCLGSFALSEAVFACNEEIEERIVGPFVGRIDDECERMGWLDVSEKLSPAIRRKTAEARYELHHQEAQEMKRMIETRIGELSDRFEPLVQEAIERLPFIVSAVFEEYLTPPFLDALTTYVKGNFDETFSASVSNLALEKVDAIEFALETLADALPSS